MAKLNNIKFYLAHETRDGRAVIGLSGWRDAFVRVFTRLGGGCTITNALGACSHTNGLVQSEGVTVFECYGREAEQAAVMVVVDGDVQPVTDCRAVLPSYREQFVLDSDGHDGANA